MGGKQSQRQSCAACRAIAFARDCGDEVLAGAIRLHLPPHTCNTDHAAADNAARTVADNAARADDARDDAALSLKAIDVIAFNRAAEAQFVTLARRLVPCQASYLIRETAYALDVSIETTKRYLLKHTATSAEFEIVRGIVVLRRNGVV